MQEKKESRFNDKLDELFTPSPGETEPEDQVEIVDVDLDAAAEGERDPNSPETPESPIPEWAKVPDNLKLPVGKTVLFLRFRAAWTDTPSMGERHVVIWNLTEADEILALKRVGSNNRRAIDELAKQMIRAIDGHKADWRKPGPHNPATFYGQIGGKCRQVLKATYAQRHTLDTEESIDFLVHCAAALSAAG